MKLTFFYQLMHYFIHKFINILMIRHIYVHKTNELYLYVRNYKTILPLFFILKKNTLCQFKILNDICVIDNPSKVIRFSIVYNLFSLIYNFRFFIKIFIKESNYLESVGFLYKNSIWLERELWDMFGIYFYNNIDLRRILSDYGFDGYPLRKDFPLTGYIELRYDDNSLNLRYEPVELSQDYRIFSFASPWENINVSH